MGSYIKIDEFEYNNNEYNNIIEAYLSFTEEMKALCKENQKFMFYGEIEEKVFAKKLNSENKQNIPLLKRVCALVHQSRINIIEKNKHEPSIVRITSLFVYYIIKMQPIKTIITTKGDDKNKDKLGWYDLEMSARFGMYFAKYIFEKHNEKQVKDNKCEKSNCDDCKKCIFIDFLFGNEERHKEYKETLMFTLTYKTVSKAMIIQLFDYFDKRTHKNNKKKDTTKTKTTIQIPNIHDNGEENE